jgi:spore coat protein A, manganese oxidase
MMDRRKFLRYIGLAGAGSTLLSLRPAWASHKLGASRLLFVPPPGGPPYPPGPYPSGPNPTTDPSAMAALQAKKYTDPLLSSVPVFPEDAAGVYNIQMAQTTGTVSSVFGKVTNVYAYGRTADPATLHYPGFSFDVTQGSPISVNFTNNLPAGPHLLPTDPTIDGATVMAMYPLAFPAGFTYQNAAMGSTVIENRAVVHLHGGDVNGGFDDGWPDWWTDPSGVVAPNVQTVNYPNAQAGCCLWYHDHGMATTRLNVHAGLAGFYFIRDSIEAGLNIPQPGNQAAFEVPLVIQDRMFDINGQFLFPHQGSGGMLVNPNVNQQPTWPSGHPYWVPEYFGDVAVVNGTAWPNMNVEARKYRFRLLNGCNARMLNLSLRIMMPLGSLNTLPFHIIGTDQGFLKTTSDKYVLFMIPASRFDVIVDFSKLPVGTVVFLYSDSVGPWPGGGGNVLNEIMSFTVGPVITTDTTVIPASPDPSYAPVPTPVAKKRYISLNEWIDPGTSSSMGMMLGEGLGLPGRTGLPWGSPVTITPKVGTTEDWYFINRTGDGHPMHLHLVRFQFVKRFYIDAVQFDLNGTLVQVGPTLGVTPSDNGWKDTILVPPGDGVTVYQVTVIRARFQKTGAYPYHCHIIDHEDNDMMRWFQVVP